MKVSAWKIAGRIILSLLLIFVLLVTSYVLYVVFQYSRIEDNLKIGTSNNQTRMVTKDREYLASTYNIGFGAYDHEFDFFMDYGKYKPKYGGAEIQGRQSKAKSRDRVIRNTKGSIDILKADSLGAELDFMFFQEMDIDSTRSYHIDQYKMMRDAFSKSYGMGSMFASNFHTAYFIYPIYEPHGKSNSGLATFSKYNIKSNLRRSYPSVTGGFKKFFDLDRCFVITRLPVEGTDKELVLINTHMSAYDEGGTVRAKQLKMLNDVLTKERNKGNYVVVGGDFNHDIANSKTLYESYEVVPEWVYQLYDGVNVKKAGDETYSNIASGYRFAVDRNEQVPTCRCCEMPYQRDKNGVVKNYCAILDGFIVSDNVEVIKVTNIDADFKYSDHNPVTLKFRLK